MSNSYKTSNRYIFLTKSSIIKFSKEKFTTKLTLNSLKPRQNERILPILRKNRDFGDFLSNKPRNRENPPKTEISVRKPSNGNTVLYILSLIFRYLYWNDQGRKVIERSRLDGSDRRTIVENMASSVDLPNEMVLLNE